MPRDTWYGSIDRDFQKVKQDIGTVQGELKVNENLTLNNRFRAERSILNYIGTIAEAPNLTTFPIAQFPNAGNPLYVQLNAQSRYQVADVVAEKARNGITTMLPSPDAPWVGEELTRRFDFAWYGNLDVDSPSWTTFRQTAEPLLAPAEAPRA